MRILMYHDIVPGTPQDVHSVSANAFAAQMKWLSSAGYHILTIEDWFAARQSGGSVPRKSVAITFDDGYENNHSLAWPMLADHGFSATIFLVTGVIGTACSWRKDELARINMLAPGQIQEMDNHGIRFGSHTVSHAKLTRLTDRNEVERELAESKIALEDLLGREVVSLGYPYSLVDGAVKRLVEEAGYQLACTYEPDYVGGPGDDAFQLRRIGILASDTLESFGCKVRATIPQRLRWYRRRLKQFIRQTAKRPGQHRDI